MDGGRVDSVWCDRCLCGTIIIEMFTGFIQQPHWPCRQAPGLATAHHAAGHVSRDNTNHVTGSGKTSVSFVKQESLFETPTTPFKHSAHKHNKGVEQRTQHNTIIVRCGRSPRAQPTTTAHGRGRSPQSTTCTSHAGTLPSATDAAEIPTTSQWRAPPRSIQPWCH